MRTIQVIGIGAGDPDHLTFQAAAALGRTDVVFAVDKGEVGADLAGLRATLLARHAAHPHKVVAVADPPRDRTAYAYQAAVAAWQERRAALYAEMLSLIHI